jgi:hypothetical protein
MPNTNTSPQVLQGAAPVVPSRENGHAFERLRHLADAIDYARRSFDDATDRARRAQGSAAQLWREAADAFESAYQTMLTLQGKPDAESFPIAKDLLHDANHKADEALAASDAS